MENIKVRTGPPYACNNETELRRMVQKDGLTDPQIARKVGCNRKSVAAARKRYGIPPARPRKQKGSQVTTTTGAR